MRIAGIDYSMTCPAVTVIDLEETETFSYDMCKFYYYIDKKKFDLQVEPFYGKLQTVYNSQMERFNLISDWAMELVKDCDFVGLEDYSMGSKGKVFHIAENTGILKYKLWKSGIKFETYPPSIIKKFATDKGNADKFKMQDSFISETGIDIKPILGQTEKQWSPSGDIIDSYYIAKLALDNYTNN